MATERFNAARWLVDRHVDAGAGDAVAFRHAGGVLTYQGLQELVCTAANGLHGLGVRPGDRVLMVVDDEPAFPTFFLAGLRMGAVPVPVSTMLRAEDIAALVTDAGAETVVLSARHAAHLPTLARAAPAKAAVVTGGSPDSVTVGGLDVVQWSSFDDRTEAPVADTDVSTSGFWLYTSGTTGRPKGAIHRHGDLRAVADTYARSVLGIGAGDLCYSVAKLFFAFGLGNSLVFPLAAGASAVIDPEAPSPARAAELLGAHRPSLFFAPPGFCAAMVDAGLAPDLLSSVRATVTAGEALPAEVQRRFTERFGTKMLDGIGSTEALHIFCSNHPGDVKPGTSGKPVAGYDLKLLDEHGEEITTSDVSGALWVRGASVAAGYWQRPEITAATFVDGWLRTGDVYSRSADGYYRFVGRNSDMIKAGGIWVSPAEVENVLVGHDDVLEAAVVGGRDDAGLEITVAFVVPRSGHRIDIDELDAHCRAHMAAFKRPRVVRVVDALPKTPTGKIQRFLLRSSLEAEPTR